MTCHLKALANVVRLFKLLVFRHNDGGAYEDEDEDEDEEEDEDEDDVEDEITDILIHCMGWRGFVGDAARTIKIETGQATNKFSNSSGLLNVKLVVIKLTTGRVCYLQGRFHAHRTTLMTTGPV